MTGYSLKELKSFLSERSCLAGDNGVLISLAIDCIENGHEFRAEEALKKLASNLDKTNRVAARRVQKELKKRKIQR